MKNIELIKPKLEDYWYEKKLQSDEDTMNYNAGYDVNYFGYHYNTGCIDFPKEKWEETYNNRIKDKKYFAYIFDHEINSFIGYVNYHYNKNDKRYECGILIESIHRNKGYSKDALKLLVREAYKNGVKKLYDSFENDRIEAIKLFKSVGFEIDKESIWKKFNKDVSGVTMKINTSDILPNIENISTIEDVLDFMKNNIQYGWIDINSEIHIGNMKGFRRLYKTMSIEDILKYQIGTCIDQVKLMNYLLNKINIKSKMFCTRIFESNSFDNLDEEEHMHCFILCFLNNKVYHIEHPNWYRIGIYEYDTEEEAIDKINNYYIELSKGIVRPVTEFFEIKTGLTFKEFNNYVNDLGVDK